MWGAGLIGGADFASQLFSGTSLVDVNPYRIMISGGASMTGGYIGKNVARLYPANQKILGATLGGGLDSFVEDFNRSFFMLDYVLLISSMGGIALGEIYLRTMFQVNKTKVP